MPSVEQRVRSWLDDAAARGEGPFAWLGARVFREPYEHRGVRLAFLERARVDGFFAMDSTAGTTQRTAHGTRRSVAGRPRPRTTQASGRGAKELDERTPHRTTQEALRCASTDLTAEGWQSLGAKELERTRAVACAGRWAVCRVYTGARVRTWSTAVMALGDAALLLATGAAARARWNAVARAGAEALAAAGAAPAHAAWWAAAHGAALALVLAWTTRTDRTQRLDSTLGIARTVLRGPRRRLHAAARTWPLRCTVLLALLWMLGGVSGMGEGTSHVHVRGMLEPRLGAQLEPYNGFRSTLRRGWRLPQDACEVRGARPREPPPPLTLDLPSEPDLNPVVGEIPLGLDPSVFVHPDDRLPGEAKDKTASVDKEMSRERRRNAPPDAGIIWDGPHHADLYGVVGGDSDIIEPFGEANGAATHAVDDPLEAHDDPEDSMGSPPSATPGVMDHATLEPSNGPDATEIEVLDPINEELAKKMSHGPIFDEERSRTENAAVLDEASPEPIDYYAELTLPNADGATVTQGRPWTWLRRALRAWLRAWLHGLLALPRWLGSAARHVVPWGSSPRVASDAFRLGIPRAGMAAPVTLAPQFAVRRDCPRNVGMSADEMKALTESETESPTDEFVTDMDIDMLVEELIGDPLDVDESIEDIPAMEDFTEDSPTNVQPTAVLKVLPSQYCIKQKRAYRESLRKRALFEAAGLNGWRGRAARQAEDTAQRVGAMRAWAWAAAAWWTHAALAYCLLATDWAFVGMGLAAALFAVPARDLGIPLWVALGVRTALSVVQYIWDWYGGKPRRRKAAPHKGRERSAGSSSGVSRGSATPAGPIQAGITPDATTHTKSTPHKPQPWYPPAPVGTFGTRPNPGLQKIVESSPPGSELAGAPRAALLQGIAAGAVSAQVDWQEVLARNADNIKGERSVKLSNVPKVRVQGGAPGVPNDAKDTSVAEGSHETKRPTDLTDALPGAPLPLHPSKMSPRDWSAWQEQLRSRSRQAGAWTEMDLQFSANGAAQRVGWARAWLQRWVVPARGRHALVAALLLRPAATAERSAPPWLLALLAAALLGGNAGVAALLRGNAAMAALLRATGDRGHRLRRGAAEWSMAVTLIAAAALYTIRPYAGLIAALALAAAPLEPLLNATFFVHAWLPLVAPLVPLPEAYANACACALVAWQLYALVLPIWIERQSNLASDSMGTRYAESSA